MLDYITLQSYSLFGSGYHRSTDDLKVKEYSEPVPTKNNEENTPEVNDHKPVRLPKEVLMKIFSYLDKQTLLKAIKVSRSWQDAATDGSLWKNISVPHDHELFKSADDPQRLLLTLIDYAGPCLRSLNLSGLGIVKSELLKQLSLKCIKIVDLRMEYCYRASSVVLQDLLRSLSDLRILSLSRAGLPNCGSILLEASRDRTVNWKHLDLSNVVFQDKQESEKLFQALCNAPDIERLMLNGTNIEFTENMVNIMTHLKNLKYLYVDKCTGLTCHDVAALLSIPGLQHLSLEDTSSWGYRSFRCDNSKASKLKYLSLSGCVELGDEFMAVIIELCPTLRTLQLDSCGGLSDQTLFNIAEAEISCHLEYLNVSFTVVGNEGLLRLFKTCRKLRCVYADGCKDINEQLFTELAKPHSCFNEIVLPDSVRVLSFDDITFLNTKIIEDFQKFLDIRRATLELPKAKVKYTPIEISHTIGYQQIYNNCAIQ
ncbi:hypothetical protein MP638_002063 [Amoeboaphelidium occidentale]|nr:hypothetical protein MP638_002063 [Amoeboaphelidium occidentale]